MKLLTEAEIQERLSNLSGWQLKEKSVQKQYKFDSFDSAMKFVNQIADHAESVNHHPDILIEYDKVTLTLTTHFKGGLTHRDFDLAGKADQIYASFSSQ